MTVRDEGDGGGGGAQGAGALEARYEGGPGPVAAERGEHAKAGGEGARGEGKPAPVDRRRRADESVATRFTRPMNAATSPWGLLCDPPFVALTTAVLLLATLGALETGVGGAASKVLVGVVALPTLLAVAVALRLRSARAAIVDWLASLPFAVDNMNALLNGLGDSLEVRFVSAMPTPEQVNPRLDEVHADCFVTDTQADDRRIEIRIGVLDSKRNPHGSTHRRYRRCRDLVEKALVPLTESFPIASVRVK